MTIEEGLVQTLGPLVGDRVYPDVADEGVEKPYITFQQIGGLSINFLDNATIPDRRHSRFQINIWGETRKEVAALALGVEDALRAVAEYQTTVEGAAVAVYEPDTKLRGSRQDFSFLA